MAYASLDKLSNCRSHDGVVRARCIEHSGHIHEHVIHICQEQRRSLGKRQEQISQT